MIRRFVGILILAFLIGWVLHHLSLALERSARPAGFGRGLLQGACMPMSLPNLVVGNDITIYAAHNTGLTYKLGYTAGVNIAGVFFFGFFFRRLNSRKKEPKN